MCRHRFSSLIMIAAVVVSICSNSYAVARIYRVAILPFEVNSKEDLVYVRDGILALLPSRVAVPDRIEVVDTAETKQMFCSKAGVPESLKKIISVAKQSDIDFVITGSITKIGRTISIDSSLVDVHDPRQKRSFPLQTDGLEKIIPEINGFSAKLRKAIIEGPEIPETATRSEKKENRRGTAATSVHVDAGADSREALTESSIYDGHDPEMRKHTSGKVTSVAFRADPSRDFSFKSEPMHCIAAGDLNGDGIREIILSGMDSLDVFSMTGSGFKKVLKIDTRTDETIIHVDTDDLNGDGKDEIFVSSYQGQYAYSSVIELDADMKNYKRSSEGLKWFFRSDSNDKGGKILTGQRVDLSEPFSGPIHRFMCRNGKPVASEEIIVPGGVGIYAYSEADIDGDGQMDYIVFNRPAFSSAYRLNILSYTGRVKWLDVSKMGGSPNFFTVTMNGDDMEEKEVVPMRILCEDVNGDNKSEIIVAKNSKSGSGIMNKFVFFDQGEMYCLQWTGSDLVPIWKSSLFKDYITDYMLEDLDKDGKKELYVLSVSEEGMWGKAMNKVTCFQPCKH